MEKNWKKRWMAGAMAFALCCTTLLQTGASAVSAAEVGGVSAQSETQIEVQTETQTETQTEKSEEELIEETVADPELALMVTEGEAFDIQNDFTGLKLSDGDHVELKKAAMEDGTVFDYNHAGTYKCVYLVTPASGEAYLVARNITVTPREAETDGSNGGQEQESGDDEPEADPVLPTISPEDAPETQEEPEETEEPEEEEAEGFSDEETEDGSHQVDIVQGNEFNIELDHEDGRYQTGETVNFSGDIPQGSLIAVGTSLVEANQTENTEDLLYAEVSYDEGTNSFSFEMPEDDVALSVLYDQAEGGISTVAASDGDLWDDSTDIEANTYYYYSDGKLHPFDSVMGQGGNDSYKYIRYKAGGKTYTVYAYCMQHSKQSPPSGTTYKNMVELDEGGDDRYLRKAMFYGYGGPGWGGTFNGYNIKSIMEKYGCSSETRAMQHYLVDYLYDGESGFGGSLSTTAKNMLKEIKAALAKMPDPTTMELTPGLSASANGNQSPTFTWKANAAFVITVHLENGVSLVNETTGKTGTGNVSVKGGEKFHLEATTQNIGSLKGKYAITSNYPLNFHAMLLKLANSQDIGFGYYTDTLELNLEVDWPDEATVKIIKKDKGSNALLAGAVYGIYADEACTKLIKKMPATNAKGESEVKITKTQDTVYLREISGPSGYVLDTKAYGVKLVVGQTASKNLTDKEQKGALTIYKEGEVLTGATVTENGVTFTYEKRKLKGAVYSVYAGADIKAADGTLIYKKGALVKDNLVTGDDGSVTLKDLYLGTYTVTETKAPDNYVCKGESKTIELVYAGQTVEVQTGSATFLNERQKAAVRVEKQDEETKNPLSGAIYGLYAREDINHPDGRSGVLYKKDEQVATLTTDKEGKASVSNLYLGKYYLKEITPPVGYLLDEEEHDVNCDYEGDQVETVKRNTVSKEDVIKQPFQLIKAADNDKTDADLLKGAGFSAYLISSLTVKDDGSYDFTNATPIVLTEDGKTEMFTDERGYACSIPIPYGRYIVRETTTPHNFMPVDDFIVTVTENSTTPQVWRVLLDDEFKAKLKIVKQDDETKLPVLLANTEFKVYDLDAKKYVEQVTTYPNTVVHKSYFTDENGYLILPESLKCGNYRIEEVSAPDGYTQNTQYVEIKVDKNTAYQMDSVSGDAIITVTYENHPVKGKLVIHKSGETLKSFKKDFVYEETSLEGAEFEIYAAEDIFTPDHQVDEQGNRHVIYAKDTLVKTVTTDKNGEAVIKDLPLGKYRVKETKTPAGFVLNPDSQEVSFIYKDQNTPEIEEKLEFSNERQKVELSVEKQDAETGKALKGATFGLYNKEAISSGDKVIVKADTLLQEITSNEKGKAAFTLDLPLGRYYVKELQAPAGYVSSDEILEFDATYQGQDVKTIKLKSVKKNQPTTVEVTKADITTGTELDGASMSVLDKDGNVIDSWTSVKDSPHVIKRLQVGKTYILREELAPYGYLRATDVEFTISDTAEVQKVKMEDEVPVARLLVNKKGEFLDSVSLLDNAKGMIEHLFNYVTGNLTDVTFNVYAAEAIRAADGVSADYYAADELVGSITTDGNGIAQMDNLPLGRYYIVEKETSHGYVLDNEPRYVDLTYRDQDTPLVTYSADWQNARQRVQVEVLKKEKDSDKVLSGAIFGLYAADDIVSSKGKVLLAKDTLIELKTTDEDGKIQFVADLPVDSRYYIKELAAPDGYVTDQEPQEFTFEYQGSGTSVAEYAFTFEDEQTTVELSKADLTDKKELPGASLKVTDEDGNTVDEWVSKEEAHIIKGLIVGKKYKMTETKPADGYVTAESIEFTVENTKEVQKHQMLDDVTKVEISKKDIADSSEVPGAKLIILDKDGKKVESWTSTDKPHMVEKLPVGKYTLREEQAPDGYLIAEDVKFTVKDTGKVQKVKMKDAHPYGKLVIKKTDSTSKAALPGAEFELREKENGKVVEKLVTDKTGTATSGKIPIATYKNGKVEKTVEYILVETKAPNGYELSNKKEEIRFEYKDGKTKVIEIVKEIKNTKSPSGSTPTGNSPKTGDSTNIWLPILLAVLSACGIGGVIWYKKKKGN